MGRRWNPDDIPDMETLVADGDFLDILIYPDKHMALSEINPSRPWEDDTPADPA